MKWKPAECERTGREVFLIDGFFVASSGTGKWSFISDDAPPRDDDTAIMAVKVIMKSPEALVDWLARLNENPWFDAKKFVDFLAGLGRKNDLYGSL